MSTPQRSFSPDYKREAVHLGNTSQAARDLGISPNLIHRWRRQLREDGHRALPGNGHSRDEEVARLKRELPRSQEQVAILKKTVGTSSKRRGWIC